MTFYMGGACWNPNLGIFECHFDPHDKAVRFYVYRVLFSLWYSVTWNQRFGLLRPPLIGGDELAVLMLLQSSFIWILWQFVLFYLYVSALQFTRRGWFRSVVTSTTQAARGHHELVLVKLWRGRKLWLIVGCVLSLYSTYWTLIYCRGPPQKSTSKCAVQYLPTVECVYWTEPKAKCRP
jgi:hypothetical protein